MKGILGSLKGVVGLSLAIARAEFKLRNEGSYLGIFWYLLNPIFLVGLLFLIFSNRLGVHIPNYFLYLFLGIIMFNFFQNSTIESTKSILRENTLLIKSINFPREALVGGIIFKTLFSHLFEIILFMILLLIFSVPVIGIFYYLIILAVFSVFVFGVSLILAALTVYFIDLENIWGFAVRLIWFGTPIFYAIESQTRLFYLNLFNPMYYFITLARGVVLYSKMPANGILFGAIGYALLFFFMGLLLFTKLKNKFAEKI